MSRCLANTTPVDVNYLITTVSLRTKARLTLVYIGTLQPQLSSAVSRYDGGTGEFVKQTMVAKHSTTYTTRLVAIKGK